MKRLSFVDISQYVHAYRLSISKKQHLVLTAIHIMWQILHIAGGILRHGTFALMIKMC